jgi:hypothetical protein
MVSSVAPLIEARLIKLLVEGVIEATKDGSR